MLLATDLDGTFLGGLAEHRQSLYQLISDSQDIQLVFVTGRGLEAVMPLLSDPAVPVPDYIICDVGGTVVEGEPCNPCNRCRPGLIGAGPASMWWRRQCSNFPCWSVRKCHSNGDAPIFVTVMR